MPLVPAICTQCGAQIEVDNTHAAGVCKHCGTAFITEKAINNYNTTVNNNFDGANVTFNVESELERELKAIEALIKLNQNKDAEEKAFRLTQKYPHEARAWLWSARLFEHYLYEYLEQNPNWNSLEYCDGDAAATSIKNAYALGDDSVKQEIDAMRQRYMAAFNRKQIQIASTPVETETTSVNKKSSHCYIATCVYGSYDCPQVWTLRRFRDYTLAETWYGRAFIRCYYTISPILVKWLGNRKWFRTFWKNRLDSIVSNLNQKGIENTQYHDKY